MKSRTSRIVIAAAALAGCVKGNPDGVGGNDDGGEPIPLEGGMIAVAHCGYTVTTKVGASAPLPGTPELGADPSAKQIHLGLTGPATSSVVIMWRTTDNSTLATTVQYGKAATSEQTQDGFTYIFNTGFGSDGDKVRMHEVHLCGLEPDTLYTYRVGGVGADAAEAWSPEYSFRTAPDLAADPSAEVVLLALGDTRDGYETWGQLLALGQTTASPDFILFTGDAVTFGPLQAEWDAFFDAAEPVLRTIPMISAHGNHDTNSVNYFSMLAMPGDEENYSLDYGAMHLTVANDSPIDATALDTSTPAFIDADLTANAAAPWKIVMHHRPAYSAAFNHGSDLQLQSVWAPIFDEHHVDVVLNGHDHDYERSHPMFANTVKSTPAEGTIYVVAGGAGASLYDNGTGAWTEVSAKAQNFAVIKLRVGQLELTAYDDQGAILDTFTITK